MMKMHALANVDGRAGRGCCCVWHVCLYLRCSGPGCSDLMRKRAHLLALAAAHALRRVYDGVVVSSLPSAGQPIWTQVPQQRQSSRMTGAGLCVRSAQSARQAEDDHRAGLRERQPRA